MINTIVSVIAAVRRSRKTHAAIRRATRRSIGGAKPAGDTRSGSRAYAPQAAIVKARARGTLSLMIVTVITVAHAVRSNGKPHAAIRRATARGRGALPFMIIINNITVITAVRHHGKTHAAVRRAPNCRTIGRAKAMAVASEGTGERGHARGMRRVMEIMDTIITAATNVTLAKATLAWAAAFGARHT